MVVKRYLEPLLEPIFHEDSYGYRPGKSAIQAVGKARQRCWRRDWVLDLDIKGFFDNIDHALLIRAVRKHTDCKWVLLFTERWLKAPVQFCGWNLGGSGSGNAARGCNQPIAGQPFSYIISPLIKWLFPALTPR